MFHLTVACDFATWIGRLNCLYKKTLCYVVTRMPSQHSSKQIGNQDMKKKINEEDINTPQLKACIWPWASGTNSLTANLTWKHLARTCCMSHQSFLSFFSAQKSLLLFRCITGKQWLSLCPTRCVCVCSLVNLWKRMAGVDLRVFDALAVCWYTA